MHFEKGFRESASLVALRAIDPKELHPLVHLGAISRDFWVELLWNKVDANQIARIEDEFFLQPEALANLLRRGQLPDDYIRHLPNRRGFLERGLQVGFWLSELYHIPQEIIIQLSKEVGGEVFEDDVANASPQSAR
ncbi:MAG: hypothetical protein DIU72_010115 [Pseudomonadota bacterium]